MKPHLILKLRQPLRQYIPFWIDFIRDKSVTRDRFDNEIDEVFRRHQLEFWVTREFGPGQGGRFGDEELRAGLNRIYRVILQQNIDLPPYLIDEIRAIPLVEDARPALIGKADIPVQAAALSADDFFDRSRKMIFLPQAHLFTRGRPEIIVAVLDTGVDPEHPEIRDSIGEQADFVNLEGLETSSFVGDFLGFDKEPVDEVGHGTHVAGIIAGKGLRMPAGVAPGIRLMIVRVLATLKQGEKKVGAGLIDNINTGIKWAVDHGADVINMSLGVRHEYGGLPHEEVVRYALGKGVTIVAASGNDGTNDKYYPGALPGVIAVGAVDENDQIAPFSTFGAHVSFVAPGTNVLSSFIHGTYAAASGTSQAAPFVTGSIALLKSYGLDRGIRLNDRQVKYILKNTSDRADNQFKTDKGGYGRINLIDALKLLYYRTE